MACYAPKRKVVMTCGSTAAGYENSPRTIAVRGLFCVCPRQLVVAGESDGGKGGARSAVGGADEGGDVALALS